MAIALRKVQRYKNFRIDCDIAGRVMSNRIPCKGPAELSLPVFPNGAGGTQEAIQYIPVYNGSLVGVYSHRVRKRGRL